MCSLTDQIKSFIREKRANVASEPIGVESQPMEIEHNVVNIQHDSLTIIFNNLTRPDGSALIGHHQTIVQAAAYGPVEIPQSKLNPEEAVIEVSFKKKISMMMSDIRQAEIREVEAYIRSTLQYAVLTRLHPRTLISITIQEIHNGGSLLSNAVTAASCALLDCGLPMRCVAVGVTVVIVRHQTDDVADQDAIKFILQPQAQDEANHEAKFDFAFESQIFKLIAIKTRGRFDRDKLFKAESMAREEARKSFHAIRSTIRDRFMKKSQ